MKKDDKVKMTIDIGGQQLLLSVPFNDQNLVRDVERAVATEWTFWKKRHPDMTDRELLAMTLFKFARYHHDLMVEMEETASLIDECLDRIDLFL